MSNFTDLIDLARTQPDDVLAQIVKELRSIAATGDIGHDEPDEHGCVALTGLPADSHYAQFRYCVKEVVDKLPDGPAKQCGVANLTAATAWWNAIGSLNECREVGTGQGLLNGPNIPNTYACPPYNALGPFLDTIAKATKHFAGLAAPATGDGSGFHG